MTTHTVPTDIARTTTSTRIAANPPSSTLGIYTGHLLRKHLRTAIFWTIGFGIYCVLIMATFPSLRDSGTLSMTNYPEGFAEAFNIEDMTVAANYLEAQVTSIAPLVLAFFPIMTFAAVIAGAEERSALDITLGNPLPRRDIVLASWISVAVLLIGIVAVTGVLTWLTAWLIDADLSLGRSMEGFLNIFPITIAFGSLALALSARLRSRGAVIGISFAVVFLMYLIDVIGKISTDYSALRWASAFRYYGSAVMDGLHWGNITILLTVSVALLVAAVALFDRRDIYT